VVDPGLVAGALCFDVNDIMTDADVLGRLIDTFVVAQIRAELQLGGRGRLYHLRDRNGEHEIDLVVELGHNRIVAIEVKAHSGLMPAPPGTFAGFATSWVMASLPVTSYIPGRSAMRSTTELSRPQSALSGTDVRPS
jgi:hypothetical protein